uniref:Growth arrest and DNA-damage-inducible, beta a n=1 Tax=Pundamilia nyererei TaxID=303518 RepID=A0A3B4ET55_9CICH
MLSHGLGCILIVWGYLLTLGLFCLSLCAFLTVCVSVGSRWWVRLWRSCSWKLITRTASESTISQTLEHVLLTAHHQNCLTVGVYESAKFLNEYPDGAVLCVLALDEEDEDDAALQIHFKLLQAFCYNNYLDILRVTGMRRLAQLLDETSNRNESRDLHCILVTNTSEQILQCEALQQVARFCEESRHRYECLPHLELQDR